MTTPTPRRSYTSPRREAQARATREALLDAADRLFLAQGYAATSVRQVATEAGVVPQTVYDVFGDKPTLLRALGERQALQRAGTGALTEAVEAAGTPRARARVALRAVVEAAAAGDFRKVVDEAVSADPRLAELAAWADAESYADARRVTALVVGDRLDEATLTAVADRAWATVSTQAVRRLLVRRGWSSAQVVDWAVEVVTGYLADAGIDVDAPDR